MRSVGALLAVFGTLIATSAVGQEPLRLATGEDYTPWVDSMRADGGLAIKLVRQIEREAGIPIEIHYVPWARAEIMADRGDVHGIFPYIRTPEREGRFTFSRPFFTVVEAYWALADRPISLVSDLSTLYGDIVCVPRGFALPERLVLAQLAGDVVLSQPQTMSDCLRALNDGTTQLVVANAPLIAAWRRTRAPGLPAVVQTPIPSRIHPHFILWGSKGKPLVERIDEALERLAAKGAVAAIEREAVAP
ncbi:substrate-binding periplasmic protein [Lacibacterium aquatile]|uniref:Substrate-binding periplasmic protein n=1 Tax=Lacibacterium aquatile TaxID=1168082 RepID=A0ABW5DSV5_9PROT